MPVTRAIFALLFAASFALAADEQPAPVKVDVETLAGNNVRGELVSIDASDIVVKTDKGEQKIPVVQVLAVTTDKQPKPPAKSFTLVQLNDGTEFRCESVEFKKNEATLKLVSGVTIKTDMKKLKFMLKDAHDKKVLDQWQPIVGTKNRSFDGLIVVDKDDKEKKLLLFDGTIGDADDEGKTISFVLNDTGTKSTTSLATVQAMLFVRGPLVDALHLIFKCQDIDGNIVPVGKVEKKGNIYAFTTIGQTTIDYPVDALVKLDFSIGKLTYLSDLDFKEKFHYNLEENQERAKMIFGPVKDKNLTRSGPIRIQGTTYKKGLALHAYTELIFNVDSQYEWFNAVVGFDDEISGVTTSVVVEIFGDGKELKTIKLDRAPSVKDVKEPRPPDRPADNVPQKLEVNIKDVSMLRIIVRRGDRQTLDFGCAVELGDARVNK